MTYEAVKIKTPMWLRALPYLSVTLFFSCWEAIHFRDCAGNNAGISR